MGRERELVLGARWGLKPPLQGMLVYEAETGFRYLDKVS